MSKRKFRIYQSEAAIVQDIDNGIEEAELLSKSATNLIKIKENHFKEAAKLQAIVDAMPRGKAREKKEETIAQHIKGGAGL